MEELHGSTPELIHHSYFCPQKCTNFSDYFLIEICLKFIDRKTEIGNLPVNSVNTLGSKYSLTSLPQMQYVYDQLMNFKQYINTISATSNINDIIMMMQTINIPSASGTLTPPSIMSIIASFSLL